MAESALYVLTSGMHGGLTSPSVPWFNLEWAQEDLNRFEPLKAWLQQCTDELRTHFHRSNFYSIINSFYLECAGFGNGCTYVGEDTGTDEVAFRFELLTVGEYAYALGADGGIATFYRCIFMTPRQVVERFPDTASEYLMRLVAESSPAADETSVTIWEFVLRRPYLLDMPYTKVTYELNTSSPGNGPFKASSDVPLEVSGFYEFPYPVARWSTIGSDVYGIGPGARALPDIKRLQEMEKSFLMATHKSIDPPLNVPHSMKNRLNTLPGGRNYYTNVNDVITEIYQGDFDYQGVSVAIERVENRIQRDFFNDIFLTGARDPNATPYKATEVMAREQEKMLRLGPVIERLQHEYFQPLIERCFNIMLRKGLFPALPPDLAEIAGDFNISLISPLATAQRGVALQGINSFLGFVGQAAQFDQTILDNINPDMAAREYANITGVNLGVLRPEEEVQAIRQQRAQAQAQERAKQEQMQMAQMQSQMSSEQATAQKAQAEAGQILVDTQAQAAETGMI